MSPRPCSGQLLIISATVLFVTASTLNSSVEGAVQYLAMNNATDTPGGTRFDHKVGVHRTEHILKFAAKFIWKTFKQKKSQRKNVHQVTMYVDGYEGVAYEEDDQIHVGANYLAAYAGDVRIELTGILYHESTHVWQYFGGNSTSEQSRPWGLIEGIADYVRLKAGLAPSHWRKRGSGTKWNDGYDITAYFLEYCEGLKEGFVAEINRLMKDCYSDDFFLQILGKPVNDLWKDYKFKYNTTSY